MPEILYTKKNQNKQIADISYIDQSDYKGKTRRSHPTPKKKI